MSRGNFLNVNTHLRKKSDKISLLRSYFAEYIFYILDQPGGCVQFFDGHVERGGSAISASRGGVDQRPSLTKEPSSQAPPVGESKTRQRKEGRLSMFSSQYRDAPVKTNHRPSGKGRKSLFMSFEQPLEMRVTLYVESGFILLNPSHLDKTLVERDVWSFRPISCSQRYRACCHGV